MIQVNDDVERKKITYYDLSTIVCKRDKKYHLFLEVLGNPPTYYLLL